MRTGDNGEGRVLWIGPGPRPGAVGRLLAALPTSGGRQELSAIADLPRAEGTAALVLLDADALDTRDIFDLERFLARSDTARLVFLGEDPGRRGVRGLLRSERVRWISWPPDIEDLQAIAALSDAGASASESEASVPARPRPSVAAEHDSAATRGPAVRVENAVRVDSALSDEIAEIERVLGAANVFEVEEAAARGMDHRAEPGIIGSAASTVDSAPAERVPPRESRGETRGETRGEAQGEAQARTPRIPTAGPSESFRAQVADLADIAQRIEISLLGLREAHEEPGPSSASADAIEEVGREVARLVQFARTLGYLVSPPAPGAQNFDLTEMLELFLSEIRSAGPDAPRCLLRTDGVLPVRSDRQLLSQAFDALFFVARSAAARGEIVRVQARRDESSSPPWARISIDFPAGTLSQVPAETILEPYGLRRILPELGPNALSAAVRIIEGQGGRCELEPLSRGRWSWNVGLPLATAHSGTTDTARVAPAVAESSGAPNARPVRAEDPFA